MWTEDQYVAASERADDLQGIGRRDEDLAVLREALQRARSAGDEAFVSFFEAELADRNGDHEEQLRLYRHADAAKPGCHLMLRSIGVVLSNLGRHEEALEWFDKALAVAPQDHRALRGKGITLGNLGRYEEALGCHDKALAVAPQDYHALRNKGTALANLARYEEALGCYDEALGLTPDDVNTFRNRAIVIGLMGRSDEAATALREYLEKHPEDDAAKTALLRFVPAEEARTLIKELEELRERRERDRMAAEDRAREREIRFDAWRTLSARSAHRIGNQFFAARGALRTLKKAQDPEACEAVADLEGCLDRMRQIIQQFQAFSTNEQPAMLPTPIRPLLEGIVRRYGRLAENVELRCRFSDGLPACLVDRAQIDQAVGELIENAIHHTPAGGTIRVDAEAVPFGPEQRVRITVADTGPGVPAGRKEDIFAPFVTTRPGGSGLGLAIVRQIVENHGGVIREAGTPGAGARFEILLPTQANHEETEP